MRVLRLVDASRLAHSATGRQPQPTGSEYSTSHVTGSTFLPCRCFRIVDLRIQMAVFVVKPELVVSRPEVVLQDRKWLPPAQIQRLRSRRRVKEFSVSTSSPLLLSTYISGVHAPRFFGRLLQVAVRRIYCGTIVLSVCLSVTGQPPTHTFRPLCSGTVAHLNNCRALVLGEPC